MVFVISVITTVRHAQISTSTAAQPAKDSITDGTSTPTIAHKVVQEECTRMVAVTGSDNISIKLSPVLRQVWVIALVISVMPIVDGVGILLPIAYSVKMGISYLIYIPNVWPDT